MKSWHPPMGLKDLDKIYAKIQIKLEIDGTVTDIEEVAVSGANDERAMRIFVSSAIRAIKKSSPLKNLPPNKFENWQIIVINFNTSGNFF